MKSKPSVGVSALCLCLLAMPAAAQTMYKSTMPDGKILYSEQPVPGAKKVEKITPNTQNSGIQISTPDQKRDLDRRESQRQEEASRRQAEIDQLKDALTKAEAARDAAKEPQEGDFIGTARGMRLTEEYLERQKTLEANVQDARKRLEEAQQAR
jgi:Skp family chaperone for outer membrane proteins